MPELPMQFSQGEELIRLLRYLTHEGTDTVDVNIGLDDWLDDVITRMGQQALALDNLTEVVTRIADHLLQPDTREPESDPHEEAQRQTTMWSLLAGAWDQGHGARSDRNPYREAVTRAGAEQYGAWQDYVALVDAFARAIRTGADATVLGSHLAALNREFPGSTT